MREIFSELEDGALKDMVEELVPFTAEFTYNQTTILNELEMKEEGLWHEEPLLDRYNKREGSEYSRARA